MQIITNVKILPEAKKAIGATNNERQMTDNAGEMEAVHS